MARPSTCVAIGLLGVGLAILGLALAFGPRTASPAWAADLPRDGSVVLSATPLDNRSVMVCLLDTEAARLAVYQADGSRGRLKLLAVRDIGADLALTDYNNDPPLPKDIRARVDAVRGGAGTP